MRLEIAAQKVVIVAALLDVGLQAGALAHTFATARVPGHARWLRTHSDARRALRARRRLSRPGSDRARMWRVGLPVPARRVRDGGPRFRPAHAGVPMSDPSTHRPETAAGSTTGTGAPAVSDRNSLTVGPNGPILLHDVHFLEQMAHFNRERIPERNVHAKGTGAFGTFETTNDVSELHEGRTVPARRDRPRCSPASRPSPASRAAPTPGATRAASR